MLNIQLGVFLEADFASYIREQNTHSRSDNHLCHFACESFQALQLCEALNSSAIFDSVTKKLAKYIDLLT